MRASMEIRKCICMRDCYDRCYFYAYVEGNKLIKVEGSRKHPITRGFLCSKGYSLPKLVHHKDRLLRPLLKDNKSWKEISLKKSLEILADVLREAKPHRSFFLSYAGNMGLVESLSLKALFDMLGFYIVVPNLCSTSGNNVLIKIFGTYNGKDIEDIVNRKLIIVWGMNPSWTNVHGMFLINEAIKRGAKLYVIDPNVTATARKAHRHLRIKPGSDVFLALGMAKYIIEEELYDKQFVKDKFIGYEEFFRFLSRLPWSFIERVTGISFEGIAKTAYDYATLKPNWIHIGYGFQRRVGGGEAVKAIAYLPVLIGDPSAFYYDFSPEVDLEIALNVKNSPRISFSKFIELLDEGADLVFIMSMNPLYTAPDSKGLKRSLEKNAEYIVVYDCFMTETASIADLVIPSTMFIEVEDVALSYFHRYIGISEKALDPPKEVIDAFSLAKRLGEMLGVNYPWKSRRAFILDILRALNVNYDNIKSKWYVKITHVQEANTARYIPLKKTYQNIPLGNREKDEFYLLVLS
ncbi:MAG: hypothetical protein DRN26_02165, partial [Thermoplasmata archaeon]